MIQARVRWTAIRINEPTDDLPIQTDYTEIGLYIFQ